MKVKKLLEDLAKAVALLSGFYVAIICLQPTDGGENMGVRGIGGWSAVITAIFVITTAYSYYRKTEEIDDLKNRLKSYETKSIS